MLSGIGKDTVREAERAADEALAQLRDQILPLVMDAVHASITEAAGSVERAAGAVALAANAMPEQVVSALDGLAIEISPITVKVTRRQTCVS